MKKIFFSIVALAALAACTKSEVAYEQPDEIGFVAVANNITKAPISGTSYPTSLDLYVNAFTSDATTAPNYFTDIQFTHKANNKWGGVPSQYWPNETPLYFSGYSNSGSFTSASYVPSDDKLTINGYKPGVGTDLGANDLMWFPKTTSYTRKTGKDGVVAKMYHTCSWITFMIQGDETTGTSTSTYKITSLTMKGLDLTAKVVCTGNADLSQNTLSTYVEWSENTTQTESYIVTVPDDGVSLASTYISESSNEPKNLETNDTETTDGNIVVIPQKPGSIDLAWTYKSTTTADIPDSATGLSLKLTTDENDPNNVWEPGKHYVYTITIKANEILIAPTPVDWVAGTSGNVTVE